MAVSLLLSHPSVQIDAITVVNGLAHVDAGARNMGRLLDLAGRKNVPVFAGREHTVARRDEFPAEWRKISDDLPGVSLATCIPPARSPSARPIIWWSGLRNAREPVQILALGPLDQSCRGLRTRPFHRAQHRGDRHYGRRRSVPGNLQDGGVFHTDNSTAEWNIFIDPMAARIVFRSGIPIRLIALDATNKVKIGPEFLREFSAKKLTPLLGAPSDKFWKPTAKPSTRASSTPGIRWPPPRFSSRPSLKPSRCTSSSKRRARRRPDRRIGRQRRTRRSPSTPMPRRSWRCSPNRSPSRPCAIWTRSKRWFRPGP